MLVLGNSGRERKRRERESGGGGGEEEDALVLRRSYDQAKSYLYVSLDTLAAHRLQIRSLLCMNRNLWPEH
jgi:hypothetical protein